MTITRLPMNDKEYRGQTNFDLICNSKDDLDKMCNLLNAKGWECDFPQTYDDGKELMTFFVASVDVDDFKCDYKEAKKNIK